MKQTFMHRIILVAAVLVASTALPLRAQLFIQQATVNTEAISPATLFQASLLNNGTVTTVVLSGDIKAKNGDLVVSFRSRPAQMASGVNVLSAANPELEDFRYGNSAAGQHALTTQRLPEGDFRFCLRAEAVQGEATDEWCEPLRVERMLFLDLVQPWNGDTIDDTRPPLSWTLSGSPEAASAASVRLALAPMPQGQDPAQAIARSIPLFVQQGVTERTVAFPPGVADLERGRCYAWQVERVADGRVLDRSEPWGFCVRAKVDPKPEKYIRLDRLQPGIVYNAVDGRLYFRYDKPYASEALQAVVTTDHRERIAVQIQRETKADPAVGSASAGVGLYALDLQGTDVRPGYHELTITDPQGGRYALKFHYAR